MSGSFLEEPPVSPQAQELFDEDLADDGFVDPAGGPGESIEAVVGRLKARIG